MRRRVHHAYLGVSVGDVEVYTLFEGFVAIDVCSDAQTIGGGERDYRDSQAKANMYVESHSMLLSK